MSMKLFSLLCVWALVSAGCSDEETSQATKRQEFQYAQLPEAAEPEPEPEYTIEAPSLPDLPACLETEQGCAGLQNWECPSGWVEVEHENLLDENGQPFQWCEPPLLARVYHPDVEGAEYLTPIAADDDPQAYQICDLSKGQMPELWGSGCTTIGDACPDGDFPDIPEDVPGARVYVKAGETDGDGTRARPFGTISEAYALLGPGDVLVLAEGLYEKVLSPAIDLTVWGACVERVELRAPDDYLDAATAVLNPLKTLEVRNVRITGEQVGAALVEPDAALRLIGVLFDQVRGLGIFYGSDRAGELTVEGSMVFATRPDPSGNYGRGMVVQASSPAPIRIGNSLLEANHELGIFAVGADTDFFGYNLVVRNTLANTAGLWGDGLNFNYGIKARLQNTIAHQNRRRGIWVARTSGESDTVLEADFLTVTHTLSEPDSLGYGQGLEVTSGGIASVSHGLFRANRNMGCSAYNPDSTLSLSDAVIQDTLPVEGGVYAGQLGLGLFASAGGEISLKRGIVERNRIIGVLASTSDSKMALSDVVILDTLGGQTAVEANGGWGMGLKEAQATLVRTSILRNHGVGYYQSSSTQSSLDQVLISDTEVDSTLLGGGMHLYNGAEMTAAQVLVRHNVGYGVYVSAEETQQEEPFLQTSLDATDLVIRATRPSPVEDVNKDFGMGFGLMVVSGGRAAGSRVLVEENYLYGLNAHGRGAELSFSDLTVRDTSSMSDGAFSGMGGNGLLVDAGAQASVTRAVFDSNREIAVAAVGSGSSIELNQTEIRNSLPRECAQNSAPEPADCFTADGHPIGIGIGLGVFGGAAVSGDRVWVHHNAQQAGIRLSPYPGTPPADTIDMAGTSAISNLRVENNLYGLHLLDLPPGYRFFSSNPDAYVFNNSVLDVSAQSGEDITVVLFDIADRVHIDLPF